MNAHHEGRTTGGQRTPATTKSRAIREQRTPAATSNPATREQRTPGTTAIAASDRRDGAVDRHIGRPGAIDRRGQRRR